VAAVLVRERDLRAGEHSAGRDSPPAAATAIGTLSQSLVLRLYRAAK